MAGLSGWINDIEKYAFLFLYHWAGWIVCRLDDDFRRLDGYFRWLDDILAPGADRFDDFDPDNQSINQFTARSLLNV